MWTEGKLTLEQQAEMFGVSAPKFLRYPQRWGGTDQGIHAPLAKRFEAATHHARARLAARGRKPVGEVMVEAPEKVARMAVGQLNPLQR